MLVATSPFAFVVLVFNEAIGIVETGIPFLGFFHVFGLVVVGPQRTVQVAFGERRQNTIVLHNGEQFVVCRAEQERKGALVIGFHNRAFTRIGCKHIIRTHLGEGSADHPWHSKRTHIKLVNHAAANDFTVANAVVNDPGAKASGLGRRICCWCFLEKQNGETHIRRDGSHTLFIRHQNRRVKQVVRVCTEGGQLNGTHFEFCQLYGRQNSRCGGRGNHQNRYRVAQASPDAIRIAHLDGGRSHFQDGGEVVQQAVANEVTNNQFGGRVSGGCQNPSRGVVSTGCYPCGNWNCPYPLCYPAYQSVSRLNEKGHSVSLLGRYSRIIGKWDFSARVADEI